MRDRTRHVARRFGANNYRAHAERARARNVKNACNIDFCLLVDWCAKPFLLRAFLFAKKSEVDLAKSVVTVGLNFEGAFAGARKTVDATEEEFEQFESGLREMSTQMPVAASELAAIAEAAGQLSIKNENLLSFTETMAHLGVTTNLTSQEAATSLGSLILRA